MRLADVIGPQIAQFLNSSIRHAASDLRFFLTIFFVVKVMNLPASILLAVGSAKERILYLAPWLGLNLSYLILASTVTLIQWTKLVDSSVPLLKAFGIILVSIAILFIRCYLCYEVHSLLKEMREAREILHTLITAAPEVREVRVNAVFVHVEEQS
ncbi:uncharacterized protein Dana_GF27061, isoform B [Drosophila ananassae]|nr:uncharacterized protein Dana_GF27061, isoform B [Drosophila ananassae]